MERKTLFITVVLALAFVTATARADRVQWSPAEGGNGHFYEAVPIPAGIFWSQAMAAAQAAGGHLATITSAEENAFVYQLITDSQYWNQNRWGPWLGGFQPKASPEPAGSWRWVTGEPFVYTNWTATQPDNLGHNESCLHFGAVYGKVKLSTWNDLPDEYTYAPIRGYIVEFEASADNPPDPLRTAVLHNPHDVDRLPNGNTLITDGGYAGGPQPAGSDSKVVEVDAHGNVVWLFAAGLNFAHGAERLPNGNTLISDTGHDRVIEVNNDGNIVWNSQNVALSDGSTLNYTNDADWLTPGNYLLITDRDNHRAIIIKRDGTVLWQFGQTGQPGDDATHLRGPHNADRLPNGNVIIADSGNNRILEVTPAGVVAWEYRPTGADSLNWPRDADRLSDGNTLIVDSEHYRLIEVTPAKQLAWQYGDLQLPYDADRLPNGNTLISKSLTGYVIEVDPAGAVVWSYPAGLVDVDVPSLNDSNQIWAVRVQAPAPGCARYGDGAPVIIWTPGGYEPKDLKHELPADANDVIIVTFLFPGTTDQASSRHSDGSYDYRGRSCIEALRDVILYAAGKLTDRQGRLIDDVVPVPVLHDNIGLIGLSNGGNIIVAAPALHGTEMPGHLRYVIQWETPVSSQVATRDMGRIWMKPSNAQGDYFNPRYLGYGPLTFPVDYNDLAYNASETYYPLFHDGNKDGQYTTVEVNSPTMRQEPDLDGSGKLELDEDFPLDYYLGEDGAQWVYSRPVTHALSDRHIFTTWPAQIATPAQADAYWDIRESVRMYNAATTNTPGLEAMVLAGVRDHVQSAPDKPHIRQAFEGWRNTGAWIQINPSPAYLLEIEPNLSPANLPDNQPNTPPANWLAIDTYCIPQAIDTGIYQLAAIRQMADRAYSNINKCGKGVFSGDVDRNCYVNWRDFCLMASQWLDGPCADDSLCEQCDIHQDGAIDLRDLLTMAQQWLWCNDPANPQCDVYWR